MVWRWANNLQHGVQSIVDVQVYDLLKLATCVPACLQARADVARLTEELNLAQKQITSLHSKADRVRLLVSANLAS